MSLNTSIKIKISQNHSKRDKKKKTFDDFINKEKRIIQLVKNI